MSKNNETNHQSGGIKLGTVKMKKGLQVLRREKNGVNVEEGEKWGQT